MTNASAHEHEDTHEVFLDPETSLSRGDFLKGAFKGIAGLAVGETLLGIMANAAAAESTGGGNEAFRHQMANVKKAITEINQSHQPNLFYGAVGVEQSAFHNGGSTIIHGSVDKNLAARTDKPKGGPALFINPLYGNFYGTPYLIAYDWRAGEDLGTPNHFTNAGTSEIDLESYLFLDLNEANKHSRVHYFNWMGEPGRLVKTKTVDDMRATADKLPPFDTLEKAVFGGSATLAQLVANTNPRLQPTHRGFKPPF